MVRFVYEINSTSFEICNIYITLPCLKLVKDLPFSCASIPGFCGMWYGRL